MKSGNLSNGDISNGVNQIEFKAQLAAPYFTEIPPEISAKWLNGAKKAASKTYQAIQKAIKTQKDFKEKIAKPLENEIASFLNPKWVSKHGLTYEDVMNKTRDSLAHAGKRYFQARKAVFESGEYEKGLASGQKEYDKKWCAYTGPLRGYKAGHILGLARMAVMALTGKSDLLNYLKERKVKVEGQPVVITTSEKLNQFRRKLDSRLVHWGSEIITQGYEEYIIKRANEELNQIVNEYRKEGIVSFTSGGDSHIDFIIEEIPNPAKPGYRVKQLGLDIQVAGS